MSSSPLSVRSQTIEFAPTAEPATESVSSQSQPTAVTSIQTATGAHAALPTAAVQTASATAPAHGDSVADQSVRVDVSTLDRLVNLVGELVLARNQILQFSSKQDDATLNATAQRLNLITTQLQEGVMKTRMQPIGVVWNKLPRVVRDLAREDRPDPLVERVT